MKTPSVFHWRLHRVNKGIPAGALSREPDFENTLHAWPSEMSGGLSLCGAVDSLDTTLNPDTFSGKRICSKCLALAPTPGRVIQAHVGDEWVVAHVLKRLHDDGLAGKPGFVARVFDPVVPEGMLPADKPAPQDFNAAFADEHLDKTWRWPPKEGA